MLQYVTRRLLLTVVGFFGIGVIVFFVLRVIPGDVALMILGGGDAAVDPEDLAKVREQLGLNRPLYIQFFDWMGGVLRLDFGESMRTGKPVMGEIARRFPITAEIAILVIVVASAIAIPIGVLSAVWQDSWPDYVARIFAIAGLAMPSFWLAILIIVGLIVLFNWTPPVVWARPWEDPVENLKVVIWPALAVGYRQAAVAMRLTRATMLETFREDYVRTARAKGLREQVVVRRHALRNALMPVVTLLGIEFAVLFGGLIITEMVFNVPGLGRYLVESIRRRDYPVVQALVMLMASIVMVVNLAVDILYGWLDPRVKYT